MEAKQVLAVIDKQTNQGILGHFGQFSGKPKFSQKTWLPQFE